MMAGPPIYQMGIFEEPISRNFWNYYDGPAGSVWTQYVLDCHSGSMYGYSDQRFDCVPSLASDFPTALQKETVGDGEFWTAEVPLKTGVMWSDGHELDAYRPSRIEFPYTSVLGGLEQQNGMQQEVLIK